MRKSIFLLFISISIFANDVTNNIRVLANPYIERYAGIEKAYARNIWDMQLYNGAIYIGAGNSSNIGPVPNAGRVPISVLNLKNDSFKFKYVVSEEQINRFKIYNNTLYIPGHDATQKWEFGNFYKYENNKWIKYRTIPNALHVYDITLFNDKLYIALGLKNGSAVGISYDNGKTWEIQKLGEGRVYTLLNINQELFAVKYFNKSKKAYYSVAKLDKNGKFKPQPNIRAENIFPYTQLSEKSKKLTRVKNLGNTIFYIGAYVHNDHQSLPFGFYTAKVAKNTLEATKIAIPNNYIPRDIVIRDEIIYLLVSQKDTNRVIVIKLFSDDISNYKELLEFKSSTFARSFEEYNGNFYFGLGCEIKNPKNYRRGELIPSSGSIIKIKKKYIK